MDLRTANPVETVLGRWSEGPGPLHRKLATAFREAIEHGYLPAGERLPSERDLAARLAVSRSTVVTAYDTLRAEGFLESRQGSGTRIGHVHRAGRSEPPPLPVSSVYRSLLNLNDEVISLACAVFPVHSRVKEACAEVLVEDGDDLFSHTGYSPAGLPVLRQRIAEMYTREGTPTTPDEVVVTTGAQQAVSLAAQLFLRPGDDVVVEAPSFAGIIDIFRSKGARLVPAALDEDGVDVAAVADLVAARHPSAIYVMPSFHNPTGALMSRRRRQALAALVSAERVPLIEDNVLEHALLHDEDRLPTVASLAGPGAPVLTTSSLSKVAWGGLRVGWMRGPAPLIARLGELKAMADLGSPLLDQAVAARVLPHLEEMRNDHRARLTRNLDLVSRLLADAIPDWYWRRPRGGPSLWVRLPSGTAAAFAQVALRYGVEIVPGEVMSPTSEHREFLRFPFTAEPPVLEETVRRLAAAWRDYSPREDRREAARTVVV